MARLTQTIGCVLLALAVSGCGGQKAPEEASNADKYDGEGGGINFAALVGTTKNPPDEFAVISKRPLELPKDFAALPPPRPGARSSRTPDALSEARAALLGEPTAQPANVRTSVAESALLTAAGASDPNIRATIASEQDEYEADQSLYVLDRYIPSLRRLRGEDAKNIVDPIEERQRLNAAAATPAARAARGSAVATIPSGPVAPRAPIPAQTLPTAPAALPSAPPSATSGELIYIPE